MTMAEQLTQTETDDRIFTFRDQHGNQTLFDRITGQSCAVATACPLAPRADDDSDDGCKHPSGSCKPEGCSAC
jgi:hypothetical protein